MANINTYLEDILTAVYGEEVRGSIHDAIDAINKECQTGLSTAGTYVTQARTAATNAGNSAASAASSAASAAQSAEEAKAHSPADYAQLEARVTALEEGGVGGCPFPVNGIFISNASTSPSSIWSGTTWTQIKDTFLYASGTDNSGYFVLKADSTVTANATKVYMWKRTA